MFLAERKVFIFGREPVRIDVLTAPSGVDFAESYARRNVVDWDGIKVPLISLEDLKRNKRASGRLKDLADLEQFPPDQRPQRPKRKLPNGAKAKRRRRPKS